MRAMMLTLSAACLACAPGIVKSSTGGGTTGETLAEVSELCVPGCDAGFLCVSGACVDLCEAIGQAHCGAGCADLQSDTAHCGDCQTACKAGQGCIDGSCASGPACPAGQSACGDAGACVDLQSNGNNCGACGKACPAGDTCLGGSCASAPPCPSGLLACSAGPGEGIHCVDSQIDPNHCGGCGTACGANSTCSGGACTCDPFFSSCVTDGTDAGTELLACVDLSSDAANCGSCGAACPAACESCQLGSCGVVFGANEYVISTDDPDAGAVLPMLVAAGDFNGDGIPDLFASALDSRGLSVMAWAVGLPDGGFMAPIEQRMGLVAAQVIEADINRDGLADFVEITPVLDASGGGGSAAVEVLLGTYDAGLRLERGPAILSVRQTTVLVAAADIYGTGWIDLAAIHEGTVGSMIERQVELFLNGDGGFRPSVPVDFHEPVPEDGAIEGFAIADLNADGRPDLVALIGGGLVVAYQLGDGGFADSVAVGIDGGISLASYGDQSLAIAFPGSVGLLVGSDGGPQVSALSSLAPATPVGSMRVADVNGDGLLDLVTLYDGLPLIGLSLRDGPTFDYGQTALRISSPSPSMAVLTGDGGARIAVVDQVNDRVLILGGPCQ